MIKAESKAALLTVLLTVGLFLSGFFVYFTPLPAIYFQLKYQKSTKVNPVWFCLLTIVVLYAFGIRFFETGALAILPMANLVEWFSPSMVILLGAGYFAIYVSIALAIPRVLKQSNRIFYHSSRVVIGIFLGMCVVVFAVIWSRLDVVGAELRKYLLLVMEQIISNQEKQGMALENIVTLRAQTDAIIHQVMLLIPFSFFFYVTFLFVINLTLAKRFFALQIKSLQKIKLTSFRPPFFLVWACIVFLFILILNKVFLKFEPLHFLTLNLILGLGVVYFLQGISVFVEMLNRWKIFGFLRLLVYFLVFTTIYFSAFLFVALGFFDSWLDLRKLEKKTTNAGTP